MEKFRRRNVPPKRRSTINRLHGAISQKVELFKVESVSEQKRISSFVRYEVLMTITWHVTPCSLIVPTCWKNLLPILFLSMEAVGSFETLISVKLYGVLSQNTAIFVFFFPSCLDFREIPHCNFVFITEFFLLSGAYYLYFNNQVTQVNSKELNKFQKLLYHIHQANEITKRCFSREVQFCN
jgi:hypothetical protein